MERFLGVCLCILSLASSFIEAGPHFGSYNNYHSKQRVNRLCYYRGHHIPCHVLYQYRRYYSTQKPSDPYHSKTHYPPYYKVSTTTTTTIDPIILQSIQLRDRYDAARNISSGNLFAFTTEASSVFTTRVFDEIARNDTGVCVRDLPPFTDCKIQELAFILNNTPCLAKNGTEVSTDSNGAANTTTESPGRSRKRRRKRRR